MAQMSQVALGKSLLTCTSLPQPSCRKDDSNSRVPPALCPHVAKPTVGKIKGSCWLRGLGGGMHRGGFSPGGSLRKKPWPCRVGRMWAERRQSEVAFAA